MGRGKEKHSACWARNVACNGKISLPCRAEDPGAVTLVLDLATSTRAHLLSSCVDFGDAIHQLSGEIWGVLCRYFEHQRRVQLEGCVAEPPQTITAILLGSKRSCVLLRSVSQHALSEVMKVYPPSKLKVFVDDITAFMEGRNKELAGVAEKVLKSIKRWVDEIRV